MSAVIALSDQDLAVAIGSRASIEAERELLSRFAPRARLYGLRHLRSEELARDLVQEVMAIVLTALREGRVEDTAHVDRFVLGTCRNVVSEWRRSERRRAAAYAGLAAQLEGVTGELVAFPDRMKVFGCIGQLARRDQTVVMLTFCEDRPVEEIAEMLGMTAGAVRVARHRAIERVKGCVAS